MKWLQSFFFFCMMFGGGALWAQSQKATIINDGALVYQGADFDAKVIAQLKAGTIYDISLKTQGPFYKIRLKPGTVGWIADNDLRVGEMRGAVPAPTGAPGGAAGGKAKNAKGKKPGDKTADAKKDGEGPFLEKKKERPFYFTRFRGLEVSYLTYTENTMGASRTQNMPFYGLRVNGPNTMFDGELRTDAEILFHFGAPDYYQKTTGYGASGWVLLADFVFESATAQTKNITTSYGFGPMFKYSHFETSLTQSGKEVSYSLDDMALGAVFDAGMAFRVGKDALRFNLKYYWEKTKYWGLGVTFGFPF